MGSEPIHIDQAINDRLWCVDDEGWIEAYERDFQEREAEALSKVVSGEIVTDDRLRADRMTRALAAIDVDLSQDSIWSGHCDFVNEAWVEARRWVEENPLPIDPAPTN